MDGGLRKRSGGASPASNFSERHAALKAAMCAHNFCKVTPAELKHAQHSTHCINWKRANGQETKAKGQAGGAQGRQGLRARQKQTIKQQPGGSGKRMLVPKHAKQGKAHKPVSSEKLALKARRREEQAARERAKAAEYAAERGQLPPPDVHIKPASFAVDAPPPRDEGDLRWLFAMDHERDAKRAARKARATAAPSKQAASFEMLREDSDDDAAPRAAAFAAAARRGHRAADVRVAGAGPTTSGVRVSVFL